MEENKPPTSFEEEVYNLCRLIPKGKVTTYRQIALAIGSSPRAVGNALAKNPYSPKVPCHRVIRSDRKVGGFKGSTGNKDKIGLLMSEGVPIEDGKIQDRSQIFLLDQK